MLLMCNRTRWEAVKAWDWDFLYRGAQMFNDMIRDGVSTNMPLSDFKSALKDYVSVKF